MAFRKIAALTASAAALGAMVLGAGAPAQAQNWHHDDYGHNGYSRGAYDHNGYNHGGYDHNGYNRGGYGHEGYYHREGWGNGWHQPAYGWHRGPSYVYNPGPGYAWHSWDWYQNRPWGWRHSHPYYHGSPSIGVWIRL